MPGTDSMIRRRSVVWSIHYRRTVSTFHRMQKSRPPSRWITVLPNTFTGLRLVMAVAFPILPGHWRGPVVLAAAMSDLGDGLIARRFGVASVLGGHLDAMTDKAFVLSVLITFVVNWQVPAWQAALLLARDGVVAAIVAYAVMARRWIAFRKMPARRWGKLTTAALFVFFLVMTFWPNAMVAVLSLFGISAVLSVIAAFDYAFQFITAYHADRPGP